MAIRNEIGQLQQVVQEPLFFRRNDRDKQGLVNGGFHKLGYPQMDGL